MAIIPISNLTRRGLIIPVVRLCESMSDHDDIYCGFKNGQNGIDKTSRTAIALSNAKLYGNVTGKEIGGLYDALRMYNSPDLNENELSTPIKSLPMEGVRPAIPPSQIIFDKSRAAFQFLSQQMSLLKENKREKPWRNRAGTSSEAIHLYRVGDS